MKVFLFAALAVLNLQAASGSVQRVIVFKFDGVNAELLDKWIAERNPQSGRSQLPWIDQIFARQGTRFNNFFVRGISLSAPSWSMLDSGYHQVLHGNVEYDRWTLEAYDYLNFFPFYINYAKKKQVDMPGVEVLDESGVPLLIDRFAANARYQSFQLYQRGNRWSTIEKSFPNHFRGRSAGAIFDEWQTGLDLAGTVPQESEQQMRAALADPEVRYLDFFSGDYDHVAHLTNDPASQLRALQGLDALIGRVWTAAMASPLARQTLAVLVSDHGMNTDPAVMSQGYSLVDWFNSPEGGTQHVITDRYPMAGFRVKGLNPFVHKVTTPSASSFYLKDAADRYPTVALDLDGNERAAIQLRSSSWNMAQVLSQAVNAEDTPPAVKAACRRELERWTAGRRAAWEKQRPVLLGGLDSLSRAAERDANEFQKTDRVWTEADRLSGADLDARRLLVRSEALREQVRAYRQFVDDVDRFLATRTDGKPGPVPAQSFGEANSIYDLQNYVTGPAPTGMALHSDGSLDMERSFRRMDYFEALEGIHVRNRVSAQVAKHPVDFIAARLATAAAEDAFREPNLLGAIWLYAARDRQAVVLFRGDSRNLDIRYVPAANLKGRPDGSFTFEPCPWGPGFPLALFEDPGLAMPVSSLGGWHSQNEWFHAIYQTRYTNGLIGLTEQFRPEEVLSAGRDPALVEMVRLRRELAEPDILVMANDHWNFNARNFNPGGNHGSFFRASSRSVLMFAGSPETGILPGAAISQPYDSLNFAPTILGLMGLGGLERFPAGPIAEFGVTRLR